MTHVANSGRAANPIDGRARHVEALRLARFLCVGLVGLAVDAALFWGFHGAGLSRAGARLLSLMAATGMTFALNRSFTFEATGREAHGELGRYALVTLTCQGFSYAVFLGFSAMAPAIPALAALCCGAAAATALSFAGQRLFTFRGR